MSKELLEILYIVFVVAYAILGGADVYRTADGRVYRVGGHTLLVIILVIIGVRLFGSTIG